MVVGLKGEVRFFLKILPRGVKENEEGAKYRALGHTTVDRGGSGFTRAVFFAVKWTKTRLNLFMEIIVSKMTTDL